MLPPKQLPKGRFLPESFICTTNPIALGHWTQSTYLRPPKTDSPNHIAAKKLARRI
uniref:Uncharacterized protein n=1 Tax=Arundo donax TaxID=35708 RepID=A0A0A9HPM7_ARUDO